MQPNGYSYQNYQIVDHGREVEGLCPVCYHKYTEEDENEEACPECRYDPEEGNAIESALRVIEKARKIRAKFDQEYREMMERKD